ncbi:MAG: zf-TFIIB domain-containing protein, partial [Candidatus Omnitrophica bacterium]|nr:zf-TFIIB domain-containing protein [Candidatus Omnitrophota bacterium]
QFRVEIDECQNCNAIWFDSLELELLQYLKENPLILS